jgi:hypothetical protein
VREMQSKDHFELLRVSEVALCASPEKSGASGSVSSASSGGVAGDWPSSGGISLASSVSPCIAATYAITSSLTNPIQSAPDATRCGPTRRRIGRPAVIGFRPSQEEEGPKIAPAEASRMRKHRFLPTSDDHRGPPGLKRQSFHAVV